MDNERSSFYGSINSCMEDKDEELENKSNFFVDDPTFFYESVESINGLQPLLQSTSSRQTIHRSISSQTSVIASLTENLSKDRRSTLFMAVCNMLPGLQGSIIFGIPFAIMKGGFFFIPTFVLLCIMADYSGLLLVDCLYAVSPRSKMEKRVHSDLIDITKACWGIIGSKCVNALNICYVIANNVVNAVLVGKCLHDIFGYDIPLNQKEYILPSTCILTSFLFIRKLSLLTHISLLGVVSIIVATLASFVVMIHGYKTWSLNAHQISMFNAEGYPLAIGIVMYSIVLNSVLPQLEGSLKEPKKIKAALHISYSISTLLKVVFGVFGVLSYGLSTQPLVSLSISKQSMSAKFIIAISLCGYAIANYSLMFYVIFEQTDGFLKHRYKLNIFTIGVVRIIGALLCVAVGVVVPYFALVSGVVGAIVGTCLVFVFPVAFHIQLKRKESTNLTKFSEILLLAVGFVLGCLATYSSVSALVKADLGS